MEKMTVEQLREKHRKERIIKDRYVRRKKRELYRALIIMLLTAVIGFMSWVALCILFAV